MGNLPWSMDICQFNVELNRFAVDAHGGGPSATAQRQ
jgi:hypothetical protein